MGDARIMEHKTKILEVKGAVADVELIAKDGNLDDVNGLIIRGRIRFHDGDLEFYVDNSKKYGCIYEKDDKNVERVNLSTTDMED